MLTSENTFAGKLAFASLCLCAFGLAFSISIAQTGLGIVLVIFFASLATRKGRATLNFAAASRLKILYISLFLWVGWRILHIIIAVRPLSELIEAREVWLMLIPAFVYLYASSRKRLWMVVFCLLAGVAISSSYGIWQQRAEFWNMWNRGHGLSNMHHLNFAGISAIATMLGLGLTFSFYYAGQKKKAALLLLLTIAAALGLWLTKSKGSLAALAAAVPVFIYIQLYSKIQRLIFLAAIIVLAAILIPRLPEKVAEQYRFPPPEVHIGSQAERRDLWQAGEAMIKDRMILGWGERGYNIAYPRYQVPGAYGVAAYDAESHEASHMHNDFINTWVLYGAVGLIIQLFYYFFGGWIYLQERFKIHRESDRPLAAAGAASLLLMAFMGLTQCHFTSELVQMTFWLAVGVLFSIIDSDRAGVT